MKANSGRSLFVIVMAVLAACKGSNAPSLITTAYTHPKGWALDVPTTLTVQITTAGFVVQPIDWR
jgi:hypothetical protein